MLPYWTKHPWAAGPASIVPDLLHQVWKGVYLDHLRKWWTRILGRRNLDARYMGVPQYTGQQHFSTGLSALTQWTGNQARAMARTFLAIVDGSRIRQAVQAVCCITDFMYRARMPQLDEDDLAAMDADLQEFHEVKQIFVTERAHTSKYGFNNISKLHIIRNYLHLTREMGTPDGFSTETPEQLHKDYVKVGYHASNSIVPEPQMLTHLRRQEAWQLLRTKYKREGFVEKPKRRGRAEEEPMDDELVEQGMVDQNWIGEDLVDEDWTDESDEELGQDDDSEAELVDAEVGNGAGGNGVSEAMIKERHIFQFGSVTNCAKRPPHLTTIRNHTVRFLPSVIDFVRVLDPNLAFHLNEHTRFGIWTKFSIRHDPLPFAPLVGHQIDLVCNSPPRRNAGGHVTRPAVFDTVLLEAYPNMVGLLREYFCFVLLPSVRIADTFLWLFTKVIDPPLFRSSSNSPNSATKFVQSFWHLSSCSTHLIHPSQSAIVFPQLVQLGSMESALPPSF